MKCYQLKSTSPNGKGGKPYPFVNSNELILTSIRNYTPKEVWMPLFLIPSPWVYGFYNPTTFATFEEFLVQEKLSIMNLCRIINSKITVLYVPTKANIKMHINLSMPCDIHYRA